MRTLARAAFALGALAVTLPFVAVAQQPEEAGFQLKEVIVTATKRTENIQDVPFSVSATSESQILDSGAANIVDLARNVAGFSVADLGPGQSQMAIRGISSGQVIRDQPGVKEQVAAESSARGLPGICCSRENACCSSTLAGRPMRAPLRAVSRA